MHIDCDTCVMQRTEVCRDCVVSFLVEREPGDAVVLALDEERAVRMLSRAGLIPTSRYEARAATRPA